MVSHAPALASATLRNTYLPIARNSVTQPGGPAPASEARDLQHEEAGQVRQSKRAKTSTASYASQPAPLQQVEPEPGEEKSPAALVNQSSMAMHKTDLLGALQQLLARHGRAGAWHTEAAPHEDLSEDYDWKDGHLQRISRNHSAGVKSAELADALHSCQHEVQGDERLLAQACNRLL